MHRYAAPLKVYALLTTLIVILAIPAMSQTLVVGTCKKANHHYTTIQSAVQAAPEDATVLVCPGTYAEQVVITTPLTLKGISVPPLNNPTIAGPSGGVTIGPTGFASIIAVDTGGTPGPVNIQGIVVDGSTACENHEQLTGILYLSTSGTIRDSVIQSLGNPVCGDSGIWVENDDSRPMTVTAKNNVIRHIELGYGILARSGPSSSDLNFLVQDNIISLVNTGALFATNGNGVRVSGNNISSFGEALTVHDASTVDHNVISIGIQDVALLIDGNGSNITGNTITMRGGSVGITINNADSTATITSNRITGTIDNSGLSATGIIAASPNVSIRSNALSNLASGIQLPCSGNQLSANIIFDTTVGISGGPADASLSNTFFNVPTPQAACP
jgi:hypothetical protein